MKIIDIFSKRQKAANQTAPDVFIYDQIPEKLRVQAIHIIKDAVGKDKYSYDYAESIYKLINDALCREYGMFELVRHSDSAKDSVVRFLMTTTNYEHALDVIELSFRAIDKLVRDYNHQNYCECLITPDDAIAELNVRFKENCVGYQFESDMLIRLDSTYTHSEIIKPALLLLSQPIFSGANDEFLKAHEHYRHGNHKESLNESLKAFESTMKAICTKHNWTFNSTDTAKNLIAICFEKNLLPSWLQSQFTSLRSILESGVPTVRNKLGGHGQGAEVVDVPASIASYAINLTATNILLLAQYESDLS